MKISTIRGKIIDSQTGKNLTGIKVEAWSTLPLINVPLCIGLTKRNGAFELSFSEPLAQEIIKRQSTVFFKIFRDDELLQGEYQDKIWNVEELPDNLEFEVNSGGSGASGGKRPGDSTDAYTLKGVVLDTLSNPAPDVRVHAFDKDLRSLQPLGDCVTDRFGRYLIRYDSKSFSKDEQGTADIFVKVYNDKKELLYESSINSILFQAPRHATLNINLNVNPRPLPSEFDIYISTLTPVAGNVPFDQLEENSQNQDITFLNKETGLNYVYLEYFALAFKVEKLFGIAPAFTYAILREGTLQNTDLSKSLSIRAIVTINTDITGLTYDIALLPPDQLSAAVANAIQQNIIPDITKVLKKVQGTLTRLQQAAQEYVQNERPKQWLSLASSAITSGQYTQLVDVLSKNYYGNLPALFNGILNANPFTNDNAAKTDVSINFNLGNLLGTDLPLIEQVKRAAGIQSEEDLPKLATLQIDDWKNVLTNIPDPSVKSRVAANPESADLNASILFNRFTRQYPHTAFIARFEKDDQHLFQNKDKMLEALAATPGADLGGKPIDTQIKHLKVGEETKRELRKMQRLYKIAPSYDQAKALHTDGIHSSYHIAALGKKQFVKKYTGNSTFTKQEAKKIYEKASTVHTAALMLSGELRDLASSGKIQMLGAGGASAQIAEVVKNFPNLKSLFQETDLCECDDCRSVYGPAAYMVDVLQFLDNRLLTDGTHSAKDVLFSRRPDLGDIDLNCDNAMTPLPYIDLVCEILEEAVSPNPGLTLDSSYTADMVPGAITAHLLARLTSNDFNVTASAILYPGYLENTVNTFILRDSKCTIKISASGTGWLVKELRQTHLTADELNACPEYVNDQAYNILQTADNSFDLPFDLYQQEGDSLLETVSVNRANLMSIFQVPAALTESDIAAVSLGIPPAEADLIINADPANQYVYWNTTAAGLIAALQEVDTFLLKSGLTYEQLQDLLALNFINPGNNIYIQNLDSSCDTSKKTIVNLDNNALDRIHRFLRLWTRTGGTMVNLDELISYAGLGNQLLDAGSLALVFSLQNLQNTLGITVEQSLSFYGLMPADSDASLYERTYLNHIISNPVDSAFTLPTIVANEGLLPPAQDTLANHLASLMQCLKRTAAEVQFLISTLQINPADNPGLTRGNLAFLYRNNILAKMLGIKLPDMYAFSTLCSKPLFSSPDGTIDFINTVRFMQSSGFVLSDLQWFLQNIDPGNVTMTDAAVPAFLQRLQTALQTAYNTNISPFDPKANSSTNQNGLKQLLASLPAVGTTGLNNIIAIINGQYINPGTIPQTYVQNLLGQYFDTTTIQNEITALLAAPPAAIAADQNSLIQALDSSISTYLYTQAKITALYSAVQSTFGTSDVITQVILNNAALKNPPPGAGSPPSLLSLLTNDLFVDMVNTPPVPPAITLPTFDLQFRAVKLLNLVIIYYNKINIPAVNLQWFLENNSAMGWLELDNLMYQNDVPQVDFSKWFKFQQALQLMNEYGTVQNPAVPNTTLSFIDVWNQLVTGASQADMFNTLVLFTGWDATALSDLNTYFAYTYPAPGSEPYTSSFGDPATYLQLDQATASLRLLGLNLTGMQQIIQPVLGANEVQLITNTLRNKYTDDQWLNIVQPVQAALRPQKRDALVAYLLATNSDLKNGDDLYDYFLVDVEMQSAQLSSRIVLAHGTLQLFVRRCLMALEPNAIADITNDDGWAQWSWMENFQVWVANRKIFLYPENWFYPELRTDKSYFFSDLMSDLQQNQVNDDNVEQAAITYLEKLDDVATLDVRACYYDVTGEVYTFHVIARVKGGSTYYYRTCVKERAWSAWAKVNVDISGDHLLTFVRNGRLFLAWPLFTEDTQQSQSLTVPKAGASSEPATPNKRYKIQLAVSEYVDGTWQPKRVSQDYLYTDYYKCADSPPNTDLASLKDTFRMINFDLGLAGDNIVCTFDSNNIGTFSLTGCKGYPEPVSWDSGSLPKFKTIPIFEDTDFLQMQYRERSSEVGAALTAVTIFNPASAVNILDITPSTFKITYPHEFSLIDWIYFAMEMLLYQNFKRQDSYDREVVIPMASIMPFFYQDSDREYIVIPGWYEQAGNEKTFSDFYQFVLNVIALIQKYINLYIQDPTHNLTNLVNELLADKTYKTLLGQWEFYIGNQPKFKFSNFYHPLVCYIKSSVYNNGLGSIMNYSFQSMTTSFDFQTTYQPQSCVFIPPPNLAPNNTVNSILLSGANVFAGTNGGVFLSLNSGGNWTLMNIGFTVNPNSGYTQINPNTTINILVQAGSNIIAGTDGGVFLSNNDGASWTAANAGIPPNSQVFSVVVSGANIFAGTDSGVFLSTDNAGTWTLMNSGLTNSTVNALAISGANIFAGTEGGVFVSADNGSSWNPVNNGLTNTTVNVLSQSGADIFAGTEGDGLFISADNGATWSAANSGLPPSSEISSIVVSGAGIFAGTNGNGVYLSTDSGTSWAAVNNGLANMAVLSLATDGASIFAGTAGGGVFLSTDNGGSWTAVNTGLTNNPPVEDIDFSAEGSYSLYNWELFFHLPYYVGNQLCQNQQFEDAIKWYQYVFNPTGAQGGSAPQKYWITRPFHDFVSTGTDDVYVIQRIDTIMTDIASDPSGKSIGDLVNAVNNWRSQPFMPDVVAQTRPVAYQKAFLMSYINTFIAWGDYLFTQNTTESKVQATSCYVMADRLLGPIPATVPPDVPVPDETYNQLLANIDVFGNALIDLENLVPNLNILPHHGAELPPPPATLSLLYFCIPANSNLLSLWSTVADRLFKIRNCEDINGNPSFTPLFAPPIDPGMLVRAAASGLDISSVLSMLNAPLPIYRFRTMVMKAIEMAQEVSNLGNALLAALEKKDAEMLSQLRSGQEISLQTQVLQIRQSQVEEAAQSIIELNKTLAISQAKFTYYTGRDFMNAWEITQAAISGGAIISEIVATVLDATSGGTFMIPMITGGGAGFGGSPVVTVTEGGSNIGGGTAQFATMFRALAGILQSTAGLIGNIGSYQRRMDEWTFQGQLASLEMDQINQQIVVAGIRKDIATQEASTQQTRIDQATAVDNAIRSKYTNEDLYSWMISQISGIYYQSYQLAVSIAQKAEQCYQYELAAESNFIQFGYWDTMHKGLLAGDQLLKDIKKMESSYLDLNKREYELAKNVSISSLDPRALLQLRNTGVCDIQIPEILFDMDYPGKYLRRIKSVSLTIPCVAGPLTTIACTLTLVNNKYRQSSLLPAAGSDPYAEIAGGDDRFVYNIGFVQSIATSSGQNDSGLFELNFADERYLPFEGMGAISSWHLEMNDPSIFAQFDYQSISDVIIQLKYTAREGGGNLKTAALTSLTNSLKTIADSVPAAGLFKVFDLKHDCPNNWYAFMTDGTGTFNLNISKVNFPYYAQSNSVKLSIQSAAFFVLTTAGSAISAQFTGAAGAVSLTKDAATFGSNIQFIDPIAGFSADLKLSTDIAAFSASFQNFASIQGQITDAWIVLNYDIGA